MLLRVCDRCGVFVTGSAAAVAVSLPIEAPASKPNKVTTDPFPVSLALATSKLVDLCPICLASALVELVVLVLVGGGLSPSQARKLEARIDAAVGT